MRVRRITAEALAGFNKLSLLGYLDPVGSNVKPKCSWIKAYQFLTLHGRRKRNDQQTYHLIRLSKVQEVICGIRRNADGKHLRPDTEIVYRLLRVLDS